MAGEKNRILKRTINATTFAVNDNTNMNLRALIISLTFSLASFGQMRFDVSKFSVKTIKIVNEIASVNQVMGASVGYGGIKPKQFDNFTELKNTATKNELIALTDHPNGVVRCYSFWALSYDKTFNLFPIILKHINDNSTVRTQFECFGGKEKVGDFFINVATPNYIDLNSNKLDAKQRYKLDSILIYQPNKLDATETAIKNIKPTESIYSRIRELVVKDKNQAAIVVLAKYKKENDINLILRNRLKSKFKNSGYGYTYDAISYFPNPAFIPLLEKNLLNTLEDSGYDIEWSFLYKAIAQYKNQKALQLLLIPFTQVENRDIREYHMNYIFEAISDQHDSIYDNLLWKLWSEENRITPNVYRYLSNKNETRALQMAKKSLGKTDELYSSSINITNDINNTENAIKLMLDNILKIEKQFGYELIRENIKTANVHLLPIFSDKVCKIRDTSFIEPLFTRFEDESNPYAYLSIAKALISYNDKEIIQRMLDCRQKNNNMTTNWGGEALEKLLNETGVK